MRNKTVIEYLGASVSLWLGLTRPQRRGCSCHDQVATVTETQRMRNKTVIEYLCASVSLWLSLTRPDRTQSSATVLLHRQYPLTM
jgi:hypothetical protein